MTYPTIFANLAAGTQPLSLLDTMFNLVGNMATVFCTASGTNTVALTPIANMPSVTSYTNLQAFGFVAANTSTGNVTLNVASVGAAPLYLGDGVTPAGTGVIVAGAYYVVAYSASLNSALGGFQLLSTAANLNAQLATATGGTTARTLASHFSDFLNILDFGADPTGAADSSAAINAAIAAFSSGNYGGIFAPGGVFLLNSRINGAANARIVGSGIGKTIFKMGASFPDNGSCFYFPYDGCTFSDFEIDGNLTGNPSWPGSCLYAGGATIGCQVERVYVRNYNEIGIGSAGGRLTVRNCRGDGGYFPLWSDIATTDYTIVDGCMFTNAKWANIFCGGYGVISNNIVSGSTNSGGQIVTGAHVTRLLIIGNVVKDGTGSTSGLELAGGTCLAIGNYIYNHPNAWGAYLSYGSHSMIGNYIELTGTTGVECGNASGITITGNMFNNTSSVTGDAIVINNAVTNFSVTGNNVILSTPNAGPLRIKDLSGATPKVITGNLGFNTIDSPSGGTSISPTGSPFTFTNTYGYPMSVCITGGTVSVVTLNSKQVAASTNVSIVVPANGVLVTTYSSAPTMVGFSVA